MLRTPARRVQLLLAIVVFCSLLAACAQQDAAPQRGVILISIDTLRADMLGAYGYARPTSPVLDALAQQGVLFEKALSTSPWTLPAHASMLTGLYPAHHGAIHEHRGLAQGMPTLAEVFHDAGYRTGAVVNSLYLSERFGFRRGFEDFEYIEETEGTREPAPTFERALDWLEKGDERPFFLFIHDYHVHSHYRSLPEFEALLVEGSSESVRGTTQELVEVRNHRRRYSKAELEHVMALYAAGIRQTDAQLGRLIEFLEAEGRLEDTLLVVTSDHGEEVLDHGGVLHGVTQYEELIQIPLVLRGPGVARGKKIATPVSLVDLPATLAALRELDWPAGSDGIDLAGLWSTPPLETQQRVLYSQADHSTGPPDMIRSARIGRQKLIRNRNSKQVLLYDLLEDPNERRDISADRPEVVAILERALDALHQGAKKGQTLPELDESDRERLEALGYIR